jgi:hypothetical protein
MTRLAVLLLIAALLAGCTRNVVTLPTSVDEAASATPGALAERRATLSEIDGQVEARDAADDPWAPAEDGRILNEGGQVRTGRGSTALVTLSEGSKIRLGPRTVYGFSVLNPFLDSLLTSLTLESGQVWVLLNDGALDVETPFGTASARRAYLSVTYDDGQGAVEVTCLEGTCSFGDQEGAIFIPAGQKLEHAEDKASRPEAMSLADYGDWGLNVPEATQLAFYATEALSQGSATVPVVPTLSPTPAPPTRTPRPTRTLPPNQSTPTSAPPTPTFIIPTSAPAPTFPPVPIIGEHLVMAGETIFCIGRTYGVVPAAIAQANGIPLPYAIIAGQVLRVPAVQWFNIAAGPTCTPQFVSPYPGAPPSPPTTEITSTPSAPPLNIEVNITCWGNCGTQVGEYTLLVEAQASGGVEPYTYSPSQSFEVTFPHCVVGAGAVTVTSADGQTATQSWTFVDVSCPATAVPTDAPPTPLPP